MSWGGVIGNRKQLTRGRTFEKHRMVTTSKVFGDGSVGREGPKTTTMKCFSGFLGARVPADRDKEAWWRSRVPERQESGFVLVWGFAWQKAEP